MTFLSWHHPNFTFEKSNHRTKYGEDLYYDPTDFYLSKRKGWSITTNQISLNFVETLRKRGAKYLAAFHYTCHQPHLFTNIQEFQKGLGEKYKLIDITDKWSIYNLEIENK